MLVTIVLANNWHSKSTRGILVPFGNFTDSPRCLANLSEGGCSSMNCRSRKTNMAVHTSHSLSPICGIDLPPWRRFRGNIYKRPGLHQA